jgi:hypothetical protein
MSIHKRARDQKKDKERLKRVERKFAAPKKKKSKKLTKEEKSIVLTRKGIRPPVLDQHKSIWLTKSGYRLLRQAKKQSSKSMAQILDDAIHTFFGKKDK